MTDLHPTNLVHLNGEHMRRRSFCELLASAAVSWPLAAHGQQPDRVRRVGVLNGIGRDDAEGQARHSAFLQAFQKLGWVDGHNVRIDVHWGEGNADTLAKHVAELASLAPEVILVTGQAVEQMLKATQAVPIVFVVVPDPVGAGIVESLSLHSIRARRR